MVSTGYVRDFETYITPKNRIYSIRYCYFHTSVMHFNAEFNETIYIDRVVNATLSPLMSTITQQSYITRVVFTLIPTNRLIKNPQTYKSGNVLITNTI